MYIKKQQIQQRTLIIVLLVILGILLIASPVLAQQGREILQQSSENIIEIEEWWDGLWETTFNLATNQRGARLEETTNITSQMIIGPVRFLLVIALVFWIYNFGQKTIESKGAMVGIYEWSKIIIPVAVAFLFLSNQGQNSRVLAFGLRSLTNSWSNAALEVSLDDVNVRSAIQDLLVTEDAKQEIRDRISTCEALPQPDVAIPGPARPIAGGSTAPLAVPDVPIPTSELSPPAEQDNAPLTTEQRQVYDYLECWEELSNFAEEELNEAEALSACNNAICNTSRRFFDFIFDLASSKTDRESARRIIGSSDGTDEATGEDFLAAITRPGNTLVYATQYFAVSVLELATFLNGLFAPIFVVLSLIPGRYNMLSFWLIENMTVGLAKLAYFVVIGLVAVQKVSLENIQAATDDTFFFALVCLLLRYLWR